MSSFNEGLRDAVRTGLCNYLSSAENAGSWLQSRYGFNPTGPVGGIRRQLCDNPEPPTVPPPFTGGQCPDLSYRVTVLTNNNTGGGDVITELGPTYSGPIEPETVQTGPTIQECFRYASGTRLQCYSTWNTSTDPVPTARILSAVPVGGVPDVCGDPPPNIPPFPPEGVPVPITINYTDNSDNSVTTDGDVRIFAPIFAPVGVVNAPIFAPVKIDLPDVSFDGDVQISPNFEVNVSPSGGDKSPGTSPDSPPTVVPDDPETTPDDDSNRRLLGIFVRSRRAGRTVQTEIDQAFTPDLYVPRLANAYFRTRNGTSLGWFGPIDVKTTDAWIPVPPNTFAILGRVDFESGWAGEVVQVFDTADFGA